MANGVIGFAELTKNLLELETLARRDALNQMAKAGGEIVRDAAAALAPRLTGDLALGMTMRMASDSTITEVRVSVGPDKKHFYGHMQELGTAHHAAQPFLDPALEQSRAEVQRAMGQAFWDSIPQELKAA
jgi:HK97 gp10 family phage protein